MSITVQCSSCGKGYRVDDDKAGKRMKCKDCGELVCIPAAESTDGDDDDGDDYGTEEKLPPARRSASTCRSRSKRDGKKKTGKSSAGNFTSPKQLIIGAGVFVATAVIIIAILFQRNIIGGDKKEEEKPAGEENDAGIEPNGVNPQAKRNVPGQQPSRPRANPNPAPIKPNPPRTQSNRPNPEQTPVGGTGLGNRKTSAETKSQWKRYTHADRSFSIAFPPGKFMKKTVPLPNGAKITTVAVKAGQRFFQVMWIEKPVLKTSSQTARSQLLAKIASDYGAISTRKTTVDGFSAMEFTKGKLGAVQANGVIVIVGEREYTLFVNNTDDDSDRNHLKNFLQSFHPQKTATSSTNATPKKSTRGRVHSKVTPQKPGSKSTTTFDGETYVLRYKVKNQKGSLNEYIRGTETLNTWTKMITIRHYPNLSDRQKAVANLAVALKAKNPKAPYRIWINKEKTASGIDFITWQGTTLAEFNIFIYRDSPDGKGLIAQQFAMRAYGNDVVPFIRGLKQERIKILSKVMKFKFPEAVE